MKLRLEAVVIGKKIKKKAGEFKKATQRDESKTKTTVKKKTHPGGKKNSFHLPFFKDFYSIKTFFLWYNFFMGAMENLEKGQEQVDKVVSFVDWVRSLFDWFKGIFGK